MSINVTKRTEQEFGFTNFKEIRGLNFHLKKNVILVPPRRWHPGNF